MKKELLVLYISFFVVGLVLVGCSESKPEWVDLIPLPNSNFAQSVNVGSITKIQKETVDQNIRINSSAPIKRDVYAVWVKVVPIEQGKGYWEKFKDLNHGKIRYMLIRYFIDLANNEVAPLEITIYYETGLDEHELDRNWGGAAPGTEGEDILKVVAKYK